MSYELSLFDKAFLRRALETHLGDWTGAPRIPEAAVTSIIEAARGAGFVAVPEHPDFAAFLRERGRESSLTFRIDAELALAELHVHHNQIAFLIPYGERSSASIELSKRIAQSAAEQHDLGLWDPQAGTSSDQQGDDTAMWLEVLGTGPSNMRLEAASQLADRHPGLVVGALTALARNDPSEDVRRRALEQLGGLGQEAAGVVDEVMACLSDPSPIIQYWATFALGRLGPAAQRALPALEQLTRSSEHGPRYGSLDAIRRIRAGTSGPR